MPEPRSPTEFLDCLGSSEQDDEIDEDDYFEDEAGDLDDEDEADQEIDDELAEEEEDGPPK